MTNLYLFNLTAPIGERSFSPWTFTPGVSDQSLYSDDGFNMGTSNRHIILIPQVESVKGIANVDEIAAVEGVAGLMLGPGDFSADAGIPLRLGGDPHPVLLDAMQKMAAAGAKYNRALFGYACLPFFFSPLLGLKLASVHVATG